MVRTKKVLVLFVTFILMLSVITGCASQKAADISSSYPAAGSSVDRQSMSKNEGAQVKFSDGSTNKAVSPTNDYNEAPMAESDASGIVGTGYASSQGSTGVNTSIDILAQRKVIRSANLVMEVEDFYTAYGNLQSMINGIGYVSDSNIHRDFYTYEGERKTRVTGEITLRVAANYFDKILTDVKGLGEVIDDRIYSTDVTDQFFDTEGRLKILKVEYEYLVDYMRSLTKPEDIFRTRTQITELQTEIERLTGTLNKWSDLVELSTITISMREKHLDEVGKKQDYTYWDRVADAFNDSLAGVVRALGDLLIFIIQAIPTLLILALIAWIIYRIIKRFLSGKTANSDGRIRPGKRQETDVKVQTPDKPQAQDKSQD